MKKINILFFSIFFKVLFKKYVNLKSELKLFKLFSSNTIFEDPKELKKFFTECTHSKLENLFKIQIKLL